MSKLLFWPTVTFFYPIGNTSAVCLTEDLSPESKAEILLLACGDPRSILYTINVNDSSPLTRSRALDITCCDVDAAILARNTLLFTLLAHDDALNKLDSMWSLFYHMVIDQSTLLILYEQCRKLVDLAESAEKWRAGPYGHFITTCDAATLGELRRMWTAYLDTATFSSKQAKHFEKQFLDGMKEISQKMKLRPAMTAARSAGPLMLHAMEAVSRQYNSYWSSGTTSQANGFFSRKRHLAVNPTFAFSVDGDRFSVHYGTDPLSGFHLAEAFTSGKISRPQDRIPPDELVRAAKDQFYRWCISTHKRLQDSNPSSRTFMIRMFAGDALMFSQALKYCHVMQSPTTPYNVAAWRLSTITLDGYYYGPGTLSPAPTSFNVIDTSNVSDHLGFVNTLVVTAPLLRKTPSATLYTETLLRTGGDPSHDILENICGDLTTMALLLGIVPSTFTSQMTTRSNTHETMMADESSKQYHERLAWKVVGFGAPHDTDGAPTSPRRLCFSPEDLASFLFSVYLCMFTNEDISSRYRLLSSSPARMVREFQRSAILHYNRRSFALFVHYVKTRVQTDWWRTMSLFEQLVLADRRLLTGAHAYHELCCQLHLLGVYSAPWMVVPAFAAGTIPQTEIRLFRDWTRALIPEVVELVLIVPRDAIARLEPEFESIGTPIFQCDMQDGARQHWFAVTSATFGSFHVSGTGENRTGVVFDGDTDAASNRDARAMQPPWRTSLSPMIITFSVPTFSLIDFGRNPQATVGLTLRSTMATARLVNRLGHDLTVFRTELSNLDHVFVLAQRPVVGTSTNLNMDKIVAGHWTEDAGIRSEGLASSLEVPCTIGADVRVQMDKKTLTVQSFTARIDIAEPTTRSMLENMQIVPTITSNSGSTRSIGACLGIGTKTYTVKFPLPVDVARAKLRNVNHSSHIEIIVPPASFDIRFGCDFVGRFAPLASGSDDGDIPTLGSIHRVNLDRCPRFKFAKGTPVLNWCYLHLDSMFSELERQRKASGVKLPQEASKDTSPTSALDSLLRIKLNLFGLLIFAAGEGPIKGGQENVFALFDTSRGVVYLYIIIAHARLDLGSHTVVADAFVAPDTPAVRAALATARVTPRDASTSTGSARDHDHSDDIVIRHIDTNADDAAAWFHLLPCLTERCRTWPHEPTCAYRAATKVGPHLSEDSSSESPGTWGKQSPLCSCGEGIGTEVLSKRFRHVAPHLTRAAFSPLFSVPYLTDVNTPASTARVWPFRLACLLIGVFVFRYLLSSWWK